MESSEGWGKNILQGALGSGLWAVIVLVGAAVMGWLRFIDWSWVNALLYGLIALTCFLVIRQCTAPPLKMERGSEARRRDPSYATLVALMLLIWGAVLFNYYSRRYEKLPFCKIVENYGTATNGKEVECHVILNTSYLVDFRNDYTVGFVCGLYDSSVDQLGETRIAISTSFSLTGKSVPISVMASGELLRVFIERKGEVNIWYAPILIPKSKDIRTIRHLSEVTEIGGKILDERYYE